MAKISPPTLHILGWTPGIRPHWSVGEVRTALLEHETGMFASSSQLCEAMGRDARYTNALRRRVDSLLRRPFTLQGGDATARDGLTESWYRILPESALRSLLSWRLQLGFGIGELRWTPGNPLWDCEVYVHHPQYIRYDHEIERYRVVAKSGDVIVEPGDGKWLVLEDGVRGWMQGGVRSLAIPWLCRDYAMRDWNRHSERHGMPLIKVGHPAGVEDSEVDGLLDDLRATASEVSISLPQNVDGAGTNWDLTLLEAQANDWQGFGALLDHCAREYDIRYLGQNLSTEIDGGSRAAATVHDSGFDKLIDSDAEILTTDIREHLVRPYCAVNYGLMDDPDIPWPRWQRGTTTSALELRRRAEAVEAVGRSIESLGRAGYELTDVDAFAAEFGIEIQEKPKEENPAENSPPDSVDEPDEDQDPLPEDNEPKDGSVTNDGDDDQ